MKSNGIGSLKANKQNLMHGGRKAIDTNELLFRVRMRESESERARRELINLLAVLRNS